MKHQKLAGILCLLFVSSIPAWGGSTINSLSGQVLSIAVPGSLASNATENDLKAMLFMEETNLSFAYGITVDATASGLYAVKGAGSPGVIAAGTVISGIYVHADPATPGNARYTGSITLENEILGIIFATSTLYQTDSILGLPGMTYGPYASARGLELGATLDQFSISEDRRTVAFSLLAGNAADDFRIITQGNLSSSSNNAFSAVPEPGTISLFGLGLGLTAFGWRRAKRFGSAFGNA